VEQYVIGEDIVLGRNPALMAFTLPHTDYNYEKLVIA